MLLCWNANPGSRPSFNALEKRLGKLLDRKVAEVCSSENMRPLCMSATYFRFLLQHFVELNQPYVQMNANNLRQGQTDFLSIMSAPSGITLARSDTADNVLQPSQGD